MSVAGPPTEYARTKRMVGIRSRQREKPTNPQPGLDERKPGTRLLSAAAVAVAVGLVAVAVRGIAVVGRIAVVAVGGLAVAIPATISTISVAVVISGGSLGGGDAAERGDGGDCDEGFLEVVHVHVLRVRCRTVRRDQRGEHHTGTHAWKWGKPPFALEVSRLKFTSRAPARQLKLFALTARR